METEGVPCDVTNGLLCATEFHIMLARINFGVCYSDFFLAQNERHQDISAGLLLFKYIPTVSSGVLKGHAEILFYFIFWKFV